MTNRDHLEAMLDVSPHDQATRLILADLIESDPYASDEDRFLAAGMRAFARQQLYPCKWMNEGKAEWWGTKRIGRRRCIAAVVKIPVSGDASRREAERCMAMRFAPWFIGGRSYPPPSTGYPTSLLDNADTCASSARCGATTHDHIGSNTREA